MPQTFINDRTLFADPDSPEAMHLLRRNELDAGMAVLLVVPIHKRGNTEAGFFFAAEWQVGVNKSVFNGAK